MIKVELRQPVMVFSGYGRHTIFKPAIVTKVGRVWITAQDENSSWVQYRFRLDDQTDGSGYSQRSRFMTMEQYAEHQRETEGGKFLHEQGIDLRYDSPWYERKAELADIIRSAAAATTPED